MFPFKSDNPYPYNQWYAAAFDNEVGRELLGRRILGESILLYRTADNQPLALSNQCIHRRYPLSKGYLEGDAVVCGYHGFTFDGSGTCIRIPSQEHISAVAHLKKYPVAEKWHMVWVWMGDPAKADENLLPSNPGYDLESAGWTSVRGYTIHIKSRYQLLNENLLDLTHNSFLHASSVGTPELAKATGQVKVEDGRVFLRREILNDDLPSFYRDILGWRTRLNRVQTTVFTPPGYHFISGRVSSVEEPDGRAGEQVTLHIVTPETPTTTHYFYVVYHNYPDPTGEVSKRVRESLYGVFKEDIEALEAQEEMITLDTEPPSEYYVKSDAAALKARQLMEALL